MEGDTVARAVYTLLSKRHVGGILVHHLDIIAIMCMNLHFIGTWPSFDNAGSTHSRIYVRECPSKFPLAVTLLLMNTLYMNVCTKPGGISPNFIRDNDVRLLWDNTCMHNTHQLMLLLLGLVSVYNALQKCSAGCY